MKYRIVSKLLITENQGFPSLERKNFDAQSDAEAETAFDQFVSQQKKADTENKPSKTFSFRLLRIDQEELTTVLKGAH